MQQWSFHCMRIEVASSPGLRHSEVQCHHETQILLGQIDIASMA